MLLGRKGCLVSARFAALFPKNNPLALRFHLIMTVCRVDRSVQWASEAIHSFAHHGSRSVEVVKDNRCSNHAPQHSHPQYSPYRASYKYSTCISIPEKIQNRCLCFPGHPTARAMEGRRDRSLSFRAGFERLHRVVRTPVWSTGCTTPSPDKVTQPNQRMRTCESAWNLARFCCRFARAALSVSIV